MRAATSLGIGSPEMTMLSVTPRTPSTLLTACLAAWRWKWRRTGPLRVTQPSRTCTLTAPLGTSLSASKAAA